MKKNVLGGDWRGFDDGFYKKLELIFAINKCVVIGFN